MIAFIYYPRRECSNQVSVTLQQKDKSLHQKTVFPLEQRAEMPKVFYKEYGVTGWRDTLEVKSIGFLPEGRSSSPNTYMAVHNLL